jgi:hypothetical protein
MSVWDVIDRLNTLHTRAGQLLEIRSALETFDRASSYNPRSSDDWDILELRDDRMRRINRSLQSMRDDTNRLGRESGLVPNESAALSRLFMAWADAHARHGAEARQTTAARREFETCLLNWINELTRANTRARDAGPRIERQREFYARQQDLFATLQRLAEQYVRYWPESAGQAQALAYMLDFERANGLCRSIVRNYDGGLAALSRVESDIRAASAESLTWSRWYANRSAVERDVPARRAPR